jgi:hypothetical protein
MATSEHLIMQNEALVALAIASAIDIGEGFYYPLRAKRERSIHLKLSFGLTERS